MFHIKTRITSTIVNNTVYTIYTVYELSAVRDGVSPNQIRIESHSRLRKPTRRHDDSRSDPPL